MVDRAPPYVKTSLGRLLLMLSQPEISFAISVVPESNSIIVTN